MGDFAKVTSLDVIRDFKAAVIEFAEDGNQALSEAQSDVQRTIWWIQNDRSAHWQREIKKRTDKLNQAKAELFKKQLESNDTRTSAIVERKNVAKWQAALDEAEQKLRNVKRWHQMLERELMIFKAGCAQVSTALAGDVPVAVGRIERMIMSLEAYVALAAPASSPPRQTEPLSEPTQAPQPANHNHSAFGEQKEVVQ
ncbi:MAG: hypothetical protein L0Y44_06025 [Phycisphaerales bacterium]|nr:hypothetical protein [Phycisphaerales bacterium]MCI0630197.1 hypothetical protein [Phycisphaerales bacterium]MCI0677205.1 hypothetical protein [Phycisphaerales bacterium]